MCSFHFEWTPSRNLNLRIKVSSIVEALWGLVTIKKDLPLSWIGTICSIFSNWKRHSLKLFDLITFPGLGWRLYNHQVNAWNITTINVGNVHFCKPQIRAWGDSLSNHKQTWINGLFSSLNSKTTPERKTAKVPNFQIWHNMIKQIKEKTSIMCTNTTEWRVSPGCCKSVQDYLGFIPSA